MKPLAISLLLGSVALGLYALGMDTTVASVGGDRVYNVGLMAKQHNLLIFAAALAVVGAVLFSRARAGGGSAQIEQVEVGSDAKRIDRLNRAVAAGDLSLVQALLTPDLDVTQNNKWGASPISLAEQHERKEILAVLRGHQASLASRGTGGASA